MTVTGGAHQPTPQFPTHNAPRVWLITAGDSPIGISLARSVLSHGDYVVSGIIPAEFEREGTRSEEFKNFLAEVGAKVGEGWKDRLRIVALDVRIMGQCQAAVAAAVTAFGRVDILLNCTSQAMIGAVEEFGASHRTRMLVRDQFETNFFGPLNIVKAALPQMRTQKIGHMIILGGITGHLGTPGLGMYCAANWALEGFCDSIAYEIAPFNIKMTIVQASIELGILSNKIITAPQLAAYLPDVNPAPLFRGLLDGLLNRLPEIKKQYPTSPPSPVVDTPSVATDNAEDDSGVGVDSPYSSISRDFGPNLLSKNEIVSLYPPLSHAHSEKLIAETTHALTAIGGHENPPARHIIGVEGVASVKEKLKTVSEELEDFVDVSIAVDFEKSISDNKRKHPGGGDDDGNEDLDGPIDFGITH
ncbi:putative short chain dehydrogenase reductase family protein [Phaeomoniella chlamydospora]|uniref:Putative short chain dehydrogenase reductase family protein n=1 Tax=Phaeomoniella chlamydospora TaxID=158046 RepID=A0A0G2HAJ1_PHACM|nr:putative short chain dehydrogenase reductase family protein [Phaeomoniella chlamydospora]